MAIFYNGTSVGTPTAVTITSGRTSIIGGASSGGSINASQYFGGIIYEVIGFTSALTTTQRQQVEGYLAHKWGLTPTYASNTPLTIPGCQLWLDAADSSTITLSTTKVTQWNDKSGNGYNFTQSTSGNQPTYSSASLNSLNTITFTSANSTYLLGTASTNFIGTNSLSVYGIFKTNNSTSGSSVFSKALYGYAAGRILYGYRDPGTPATIVGGIGVASGPNAYTDISDTYTAGSWRVFGFVSDRSGWTNTTYQNGTSIGSTTITADTTTNLTNAFPMLVGAYNNSSGDANPPQAGYYLDGGVGELLVFNSALTTSQRQQVEGYLARKWGISISATLPSPHPFKSFPPASLYFEPATKYSALFNNSSLTIPSSSSVTLGTNNHTIEFWAYQTSRGQYDCPFQYSINTSAFSTSSYYMALGGYLGILIGNNAGNFAVNMGATVSPLPSLNRWHHYAIVRNGTTFTIYINGISRETATSSVSIGAQGGSFIFGDVLTTTTTPFFGYITNFRLVNGTAVYTSNFIPSTSPLTAIPNTQILLQGLTDRSPNAFTVTNNGGVTLSTLSPFPPP
jgi:hypothetical protein